MHKMIWVLWFLPALCLAEPKTVCLNMIVKDEKAVIERCLNSIKPYIDYWVIVDTGSTDGTQGVIEKCLCDVPGELFERKWVNFAHNRNEALELAKGRADYVVFIDADEIFEGDIDKKKLTEEAYTAQVRVSQDPLLTFERAFLVKDGPDWAWEGVLHEHIQHAGPFEWKKEPSFVINAEARDGNRAKDAQKHLKDAQVLEKALQQEPENSRYVFYLAQTYCCLGKYGEAIKSFRKYLTLKDQATEYAFWSCLQIGRIQEQLQEEPEVFIKSYSKAFQLLPTRAEPPYYIGMHFYRQKQYLLAYILIAFDEKIVGCITFLL